MNENCIFDPSTNRVIDIIPQGSDGARWFEVHGNEYGDNLIVLPFEEGAKRYEDSFKTEPKEISLDDWTYALEVLPPVAWKWIGQDESFKMCERTAGAMTAIYVRIGDRYFHFVDDIRTPPADCVARVRASKAFTD